MKWRNRYQILEKEGEPAQLVPSDLEAAQVEIRLLQRELANAEDEREILHLPWRSVPGEKSTPYFLSKKRLKYTFIAAHEKEFSVQRMCHALGVQKSGYYA